MTNDLSVSLDHVRESARGALAGCPAPGRTYDQTHWSCGTACCVWGGAVVRATGKKANCGPSAEWAAQSPMHALAAGLMRVPDSRVLPVLAAVLDGRDGEAEAEAARAAGLTLYLSGERHGQTGGVARYYGTAQGHGQTGGEAWYCDTAQGHGQTGGVAWYCDTAQGHGQTGGVARYCDTAQGHGQAGGVAVRMEWRGGHWVEVSRVEPGATP